MCCWCSSWVMLLLSLLLLLLQIMTIIQYMPRFPGTHTLCSDRSSCSKSSTMVQIMNLMFSTCLDDSVASSILPSSVIGLLYRYNCMSFWLWCILSVMQTERRSQYKSHWTVRSIRCSILACTIFHYYTKCKTIRLPHSCTSPGLRTTC